MSFILDALKKSEAERRQGEAPRLQDGPAYPPPRRRRPCWPLLLTLALLLNGVVLGWWLLVREEPPATVAPPSGIPAPAPAASSTPAAAGVPAEVPAPAAAESPPGPPAAADVLTVIIEETPARPAAAAGPDPGATADEERQPTRTEPAAAPARPQAAAETPVADSFPPLSELPGNVRSGLPGLDLQLHFFTPEPERRMVRLNGHNLREGGVSGDGLSVLEITPDGVKLAYGGVRFFLPTARR